MTVLVKKMSKFAILKFEMIIGALVMVAAMVMLPVGIMAEDASLLLNPYVFGVVAIGMVMFGLFAYFLFMRPYFLYRKLPEVLAATDGKYLYLYGKKEAKIPLSAFDGSMVTFHFPFIYSKEFIAVLLTFFFSEKYGDLIFDIPGYGSYKLPFVANVQDTANKLVHYFQNKLDGNNTAK